MRYFRIYFIHFQWGSVERITEKGPNHFIRYQIIYFKTIKFLIQYIIKISQHKHVLLYSLLKDKLQQQHNFILFHIL